MSTFQLFLTNISWNVLGKVFVQVLLFFVSVAVTRYLGSERLGMYASLLVIPAFVRLLNSFGLETVINKKLPELKVEDPGLGKGRYFFQRLLALRLASSLIFGLILYFALPYYLEWFHLSHLMEYRWALLLYFLVITLNGLLSTLFMTYLQYKTIAVMEAANALLNLVLLAMFIEFDWGVLGVLYAYIGSTALTICVYLYLARPYWRGQTQKTPWEDSLKLGWISYLLGIFSFGLLNQSDVVLMNYFHIESSRIGYYYLAMGVGAMLTFVLTGIGPLALSIFSESFAKESHAGLEKSWKQIIGFMIFCTTPIYLFAFFNAESLITFIYGDAYAATGSSLSFYLVFIYLQMLFGGSFTVSVLHVLQKSGLALRTTIEGSVLIIALDIILIPKFGEVGAIGATGSVMVYMTIRQWFLLSRDLNVRSVFPFAVKCFGLCLVTLVPVEIVAYLWQDHLVTNFIMFVAVFIFALGWVKPLKQEHLVVVNGFPTFIKRWVEWFVTKPGVEK